MQRKTRTPDFSRRSSLERSALLITLLCVDMLADSCRPLFWQVPSKPTSRAAFFPIKFTWLLPRLARPSKTGSLALRLSVLLWFVLLSFFSELRPETRLPVRSPLQTQTPRPKVGERFAKIIDPNRRVERDLPSLLPSLLPPTPSTAISTPPLPL